MKTNIFRCGRLRILLLLCLFVSSADLGAVIRGRVVDAETGEPLDGATVEVSDERLNSGQRVIISYSLSTDSLGYFHYAPTATASITFTVKYFGYHDGRARINSTSTTDTINIRDIQLKPSPLLLKGVTVKARRRSFYMRGDTVIFNPEAIALEEGARRAELALYAKDIFNQQRITTSSMTENTRTEGGTEYLHRYISLTFTYRFEPRGK